MIRSQKIQYRLGTFHLTFKKMKKIYSSHFCVSQLKRTFLETWFFLQIFWWLLLRGKTKEGSNFFLKSIFLLISRHTYFRNVAWKFHKEIPKIGLVTADRVYRLGSEVVRNQNIKLKTKFFNLVGMFDRNLLVQLACSRSHFVRNFRHYGKT